MLLQIPGSMTGDERLGGFPEACREPFFGSSGFVLEVKVLRVLGGRSLEALNPKPIHYDPNRRGGKRRSKKNHTLVRGKGVGGFRGVFQKAPKPWNLEAQS